MAEKPKDPQSKLKWQLGGGLTWITLLISATFHFAIWGVAAMPKDFVGKKGDVKMGDGKLNLKVVKKYEELPPPPSIETPVEPKEAPKGLESKGSVGEVPLPVPDALADANTWQTDAGANDAGVGEGTELIVENGGEGTVVENTNPWDEVSFDVEYSEAPVITYQERPKYPDIARDSGVQGDVVLFVYIDENGNVRNAVVQQSPGLPALDAEAKKAAMKCKFKPAKQQGRPVGVWYNIVMQFRL